MYLSILGRGAVRAPQQGGQLAGSLRHDAVHQAKVCGSNRFHLQAWAQPLRPTGCPGKYHQTQSTVFTLPLIIKVCVCMQNGIEFRSTVLLW